MNWDQDRRVILIIQRNFLLLFTFVLLISIFVLLLIAKQLNDERKVEPYLIEYNKINGSLSFVESKTKAQYTAQDAVIESLAVNYLKTRESLTADNIEYTVNQIRVFSTKEIYKLFLDEVGSKVNNMYANKKNIKVNIVIGSITHLGKGKLEIKFSSQLTDDIESYDVRKFKAIIAFDFYEGEMSFDDRIINPLNYQVVFYRTLEEKIIKTESKNTEQEDKPIYDQ